MRRAVALVAALLLLAGCGRIGAGSSDHPDATPRALAAVALEYVDADPTALGRLQPRGSDTSGEGPARLGAELRFKGDGEYDGDAVEIEVHRDRTTIPKCGEYDDGCQQIGKGRDGGAVQLSWAEVEPEEDPGFVQISEVRDGAVVTVMFAGPDVKGDPRSATTYFPVARMQALADDPRVGATTTPAAVEAGERLTGWGTTP